MLHAYCVRRAGEEAPGGRLQGVDGATVRVLREGGLAMWVSADVSSPASPERLWQHDRVVRAALRTATPLPVRFGTRFSTEQAARDALRERHDEFAAALDRVAGRVEMGVRVLWAGGPHGAPAPEEPATSPPRSGREYLERRRREVQGEREARARASEAVAAVESALAGLELPTASTVVASPEVAGILAHLVHRGAVNAYREHVERVREGLRDVDLALSGPWAPYSFV